MLVRVKAAGICHSDAHYRAGISSAHPLPLTSGHEVSGVIDKVGTDVHNFKPGESVAIFGVGELGMSAVQLAKALGPLEVCVVDINPSKLALAKEYGAIPINTNEMDPVREIKPTPMGYS